MLAQRGLYEGAHPASVTATFNASIERIERVHAVATELLRLCAFLHMDAIPEELLSAGVPYMSPALGQIVADRYQFDHVLAVLRRASLLSRFSETRTISIHRVVQAVLQDQMEPNEKQMWKERAMNIMNESDAQTRLSQAYLLVSSNSLL